MFPIQKQGKLEMLGISHLNSDILQQKQWIIAKDEYMIQMAMPLQFSASIKASLRPQLF